MSLYYNSPSRSTDRGTFRRRRRPGLQADGQHPYRGYRFELLSMRPPGPTERTRYHVRILDDRGTRLALLRDFSRPAQACRAAEEWVDRRHWLGDQSRGER